MMPLLDGRRGANGSRDVCLRRTVYAACLTVLAVIVVVTHQQWTVQGRVSLLALPAAGSGLDVLVQQARQVEQQQVASLRKALVLAEGVKKTPAQQLDAGAALVEGQRLFAAELAPKIAQASHKMASLERKKQAAKNDVANQRKLESRLLAELATDNAAHAQVQPTDAVGVLSSTAEEKSMAHSISDSIASLAGQFKSIEAGVTKANTVATAAAMRAATVEHAALAAEQQAQEQNDKDASAATLQQAIFAAAAGSPISPSLAAQQPTLTPLVGVNTNDMLRPAAAPAPSAPARDSSALASATAGVSGAGATAVQNLAKAEMSLSKSLAAIAGSGKLQEMRQAASGLARVGAAVAEAAEMGVVKGMASSHAQKVPVAQALTGTFKKSGAHLADVELGEDIARLSMDARGGGGVAVKRELQTKLSSLRHRLQMLGFSAELMDPLEGGDVQCEGDEVSFQGKCVSPAAKRLAEEKEREKSTYRYGLTDKERKEQIKLRNELRRIDPHFGRLDRDEFRVVPQRFPHSDFADLGDNYIGGDTIVSASKARMNQPSEFGTFLGSARMPRKPAFMDKLTPALKKAFENKRNLYYANPQFKMGDKYPVTKALKNLEFGSSYSYNRNKYGGITDIFPSTKQYKAQITGSDRFARNQAKNSMMGTKWPKTWKYTYRWRRQCETTKSPTTGKMVACPWKWALELRKKKCKYPLCSHRKKEHWNHKLEADLEKQLLQGAVNGRADPFGFAQELGDDKESAQTVQMDTHIRSHNREPQGEPLGDGFLNGWQMTNGIDWKAPDPVDDEEKEDEEKEDEDEDEDADAEE